MNPTVQIFREIMNSSFHYTNLDISRFQYDYTAEYTAELQFYLESKIAYDLEIFVHLAENGMSLSCYDKSECFFRNK